MWMNSIDQIERMNFLQLENHQKQPWNQRQGNRSLAWAKKTVVRSLGQLTSIKQYIDRNALLNIKRPQSEWTRVVHKFTLCMVLNSFYNWPIFRMTSRISQSIWLIAMDDDNIPIYLSRTFFVCSCLHQLNWIEPMSFCPSSECVFVWNILAWLKSMSPNWMTLI